MPEFNGVEFNMDVHQKSGAVYMFHNGNAFAVPNFDGSSIAIPVTSTLLGSSATFTGPTRDRLNLTAGAQSASSTTPGILVSKIKGIVFTDQVGTLYIEESNDGNTWTQTSTTSVTVNQFTDSGWVYLSKRYYRLRYVNGATAQTVFGLYDASGVGSSDVALTGSITTVQATLQNDGNGHYYTSQAINLTNMEIMQIVMPAAWTAAVLSFQTSSSQTGTFQPLYDDGGNEIKLTVTQGQNAAVVNNANALSTCGWVKINSGANASLVDQTTARTITIIGKM